MLALQLYVFRTQLMSDLFIRGYIRKLQDLQSVGQLAEWSHSCVIWCLLAFTDDPRARMPGSVSCD